MRRPGARARDPAAAAGAPAEAAEVAARAASLLRGGIPGARALVLLGAESAPETAARRLADRVAASGEPARAILAEDGPAWRLLATAWTLAEETGSELAPALDRAAAALEALERIRRRRSVLLAGPRTTVRLVAALPPLALLFGAALGFDPVPVLLRPAGAALLAAGVALLVAGVAWARALQRRAERAEQVDGVELELAWIALGGGAPPAEACRRVVDAADRCGAEWVRFDRFVAASPLRAAIAAAAAAGVPLRPLLLEEAEAARDRGSAGLEREAERLGVRVLIPIGVCVLPAFVLLGVVPVLLAMLAG